jgi:hypothetical protein
LPPIVNLSYKKGEKITISEKFATSYNYKLRMGVIIA